jgi:peptide deformylase
MSYVPGEDTLRIITYGHPTLRVRCEPVTVFDDELRDFAAAMHRTMTAAEGVGLAASQVDRRIRLLVVGVPQEDTEELFKLTVINPEIVEHEGEWEYEEGCLSIPEVRDTVTRAEWIKLRFQDEHGKHHTLEAEGLLGRVLLHEIDHLNGVLFIDHLSVIKRALLNGKLKKLLQQFDAENGVTES